MRLDQSKNAKRNIYSGLLSRAVSLVLPFLLRTVMIYYLGSEYLGLNSLFTSILQVLNLSELGFSHAVVYSMYKPIAENNETAICALLNFYRKVYRILGLLIMGVGLALVPFLPNLVSGNIPSGINLYVLYLIYLINTVIGYVLFGYKVALLNAFQRVDIVNNTLSICHTVLYVSQIVIVAVARDYYLSLLVMPICTVLNNVLNAWEVKKRFPQYVCKGTLEASEKNSIKKAIPGLLVNKLCMVSRNSFDSIFISAFLGLQVSAIYGNYYYIMSALMSVMNIFSNSVLAGVGNSQVLDTPEENYNMMKKLNFIYMWIAGWCTICLFCLYQPFMDLWVGKDLMFENGVVALFCVYFYVMEMGVIRGVYSDAAGLWWQNRYRAILESVANLVLNYAFVKLWGIYGIVAATLLSLFVINFLWGSNIVFRHYFKNNKEKEYFLLHLKYALVTLGMLLISAAVCNYLPFTGIALLIFRLLICCILPNVGYFIVYRNSWEYKAAIPWILKKIHLDKILRFML